MTRGQQLASENLLASECKKVFAEMWPDLDLSELNVIVRTCRKLVRAGIVIILVKSYG